MSSSMEALRPARLKFNPYDPQFRVDPYATYDRLRSEAPFFRTMGTVILTRYDDVLETLKSRSFSAALIPQSITRHAAKLGISGIEQVERFIRKSIVFTDNPEHVRLRRLVNQAYSAEAIEGAKIIIAREVAAIIDRFLASGEFDAVRDLAEHLPIDVLCAWMGVPEERRAFIGAHVHSIRFLLDPGLMTRTDFIKVLEAMGELVAFFSELAESHRRNGATDNLVARLAAAREGDDCLSAEEVVFACIMSFVAGNETTQCLIGNTLSALMKHPDQLAAVRRERRLVTACVEEALRFEAPLQLTKRLAIRDVQINGNKIAKDEQVLLCLAAANRDPQRFREPDRFDIHRDGPSHVGFGYGMHSCLGGMLARLQAEIVLDTMLNRFASFERQGGEDCWQTHSFILRGLTTLPIRFVRH